MPEGGARELGPAEVGALELCARRVIVRQIGTLEPGPGEAGALELGTRSDRCPGAWAFQRGLAPGSWAPPG